MFTVTITVNNSNTAEEVVLRYSPLVCEPWQIADFIAKASEMINEVSEHTDLVPKMVWELVTAAKAIAAMPKDGA